MIIGFNKRIPGKIATSIVVGEHMVGAVYDTPGFVPAEGSAACMDIIGFLEGVPIFTDPLLVTNQIKVTYKPDDSDDVVHENWR